MAAPPEDDVKPFILTESGTGTSSPASGWARAVPRALRAAGIADPQQSAAPDNPLAYHNPVARIFAEDRHTFGTYEEFPYAATTYRLTEHFHYWTTHVLLNAIVQPEKFVEIGEVLAGELGIAAGKRCGFAPSAGISMRWRW